MTSFVKTNRKCIRARRNTWLLSSTHAVSGRWRCLSKVVCKKILFTAVQKKGPFQLGSWVLPSHQRVVSSLVAGYRECWRNTSLKWRPWARLRSKRPHRGVLTMLRLLLYLEQVFDQSPGSSEALLLLISALKSRVRNLSLMLQDEVAIRST